MPTTTTTTTSKTRKKATAKKATAKKAETKVTKPRFEKDEQGRPVALRAPQVLILNYLATKPEGASRKELAEHCKCSITEMVGPLRDSAAPNKFTKSLIERGLCENQVHEGIRGGVVVLTVAGKEAAAEA